MSDDRSVWRDGWLVGRAMSLRRLQWWVAHEWDGTREHLEGRLATQTAAVQHDRDKVGRLISSTEGTTT
jgi:hypothetical protein